MSSGNKLRRVAKTVFYQLDLYGKLLSVEWEEEKSRLTGMLISLLLGFIFFFCLLFTLSSMLLVFAWDTQYRDWVMIALACFYGLGILFAWYRFRSLGNRAAQAFSDVREELATDIALLRNRMDQ
ncbi:MAG: phage holin family protein [Pseudomonadales bacterium]